MLLTGKNDTTYQDRVCRLLGVDPRQAMAHYSALSLLLGGVITVKEPAPAPAPSTEDKSDDDGDDWANNTGFDLDRLYDIINHPGKVDTGGVTVEPGHSEPPVNDRYW